MRNDALTFSTVSPSTKSQLDRDISTALRTTREWRNSFVRINRIPLGVLSLIPTHLSSQKDRFRASFVCRHWRRTFLQHAVLWSRLRLSNGEVYVKTMLERAKGSALNIITNSIQPDGTVTLLLPHSTQSEYIYFKCSHWKDIQRFSEINSGPLPLLRTLKLSAVRESNLGNPDDMTPPSFPLFRNPINLGKLQLHSEGLPFLNHFTFPNLTTFELSMSEVEGFRASQLLDFLEASPTLQTVYMDVVADISLEGVRESVVVLPNVKIFTLIVGDGRPGYEIAAHISCPSAIHTSLVHRTDLLNSTPREIFPTPVSWSAVVRQYSKSPVEEVALWMGFARHPIIECSLTFRCPDAAILSLCLQVGPSDGVDEHDPLFPYEGILYETFHQACRTIQDHTLLASVKRLHIDHNIIAVRACPLFPHLSAEVRQLFKSVGPLEKLTTHRCDLHLSFNPSSDPLGSYNTEEPIAYPPIREIVILHPILRKYRDERMAIIVELARSQHALGTPFERMTVCMEGLLTVMEEVLGPWVGAVECLEMGSEDGY